MANNANDVLTIARNEIGYSRWTDPEQGTKYGRWYAQKVGSSYYGANGVPYCAMFVSWVFDQASASCAGLPEAYCPYIINKARSAGAILSSKYDAQPGDVVLFDWDGGESDHVGIVEKNFGSYIQTIEGNTSSGSSGSQSNGGGVYRRTRAWSTVVCIVRPNWASNSGSSSGSTNSSSSVLEVDGYWGSATTLKLQNVLGAPYKDGEISRQSSVFRVSNPGLTSGWEWGGIVGDGGSQTIKLIQKRVGLSGGDVDGKIGPITIKAMQRYFGTYVDGVFDEKSPCIMVMQKKLNANTF